MAGVVIDRRGPGACGAGAGGAVVFARERDAVALGGARLGGGRAGLGGGGERGGERTGERGGGDGGSSVHQKILRLNNKLGSGVAEPRRSTEPCRLLQPVRPTRSEVTGGQYHEFVITHALLGL